MKIPIRVEEHVTWKGLLFLLAPFSAFILMTLNIAVARADDIAKAARLETRQVVAVLEQRVDMNKKEADAGQAEVHKDIQAVYNFLLTRQRQPRMEKP